MYISLISFYLTLHVLPGLISPSQIGHEIERKSWGKSNQKVKDWYEKKFKSFKKEIEEDLRKQRDVPCSWIGRSNIIKMAIIPNAIYRFKMIPSKFQHNSSKTCKEQFSVSFGKTKTQDSESCS